MSSTKASEGKRQSGSVRQTGNQPFQFVNYDLTVGDKEALKETSLSDEKVMETITQLTKEGYKISIGWDDYTDCPACWLVGQSPKVTNHGLILSSRGASLGKVLRAMLYKHFTVFNGDWHDRVLGSSPTDDY